MSAPTKATDENLADTESRLCARIRELEGENLRLWNRLLDTLCTGTHSESAPADPCATRRDVDSRERYLEPAVPSEVERLTEQERQSATVIDGLAGDCARISAECDALRARVFQAEYSAVLRELRNIANALGVHAVCEAGKCSLSRRAHAAAKRLGLPTTALAKAEALFGVYTHAWRGVLHGLVREATEDYTCYARWNGPNAGWTMHLHQDARERCGGGHLHGVTEREAFVNCLEALKGPSK